VALLRDDRIRLTIHGLGGDSARLQGLAVRLGVAHQVIFAGFLNREQLPPVYQASDIFVLPSHSESCAMALLEAMACGLPVIATAVGGTTEHVTEGLNGRLVAPGQPERLAEALRRLIDDPAGRRAMGAENAQAMRRAYSWDGITGRYLEIYRRLANK
jgi:glycosyltransferase involved in cell wall biosynthesis